MRVLRWSGSKARRLSVCNYSFSQCTRTYFATITHTHTLHSILQVVMNDSSPRSPFDVRRGDGHMVEQAKPGGAHVRSSVETAARHRPVRPRVMSWGSNGNERVTGLTAHLPCSVYWRVYMGCLEVYKRCVYCVYTCITGVNGCKWI